MSVVSVTSFEQEQDGLFYENNNIDNNDDNDDDEISITIEKTTERQSFLHLLKGYVGPGCLSLPWAVSQLGVVTGVSACFVMAYWSSRNCWAVVKLKQRQQQRQQQMTSASASTSVGGANDDDDDDDATTTPSSSCRTITYPDVAQWLYGAKMYRYTTLCICVQQLAICTVFLSFVGANLQAVLQSVWEIPVNHVAVITMALPAVLALSFLPNLKALAPVTALGTALLLLGLGLLAVVVVMEWPQRPHYSADDTNNMPNNDVINVDYWKQVPLALCAILYSYEGICLILPVESSMARPNKFFHVFWFAMLLVAIIFATVSAVSVAAFGAVTNGSITAFLLQKYSNNNSTAAANIRAWLLAANASVSLSVLVTYPLQLFPCIELMGPLLSRRGGARGGRETHDFYSLPDGEDSLQQQQQQQPRQQPEDDLDESDRSVNNTSSSSDNNTVNDHDSPMVRIALVFLTYLVAVVVPNVQVLISLAGALAGSSTALLIPPLLELAWLRQNDVTTGWKITQCYFLLAGGLIFLCIGTVASIADIVRVYSGHA